MLAAVDTERMKWEFGDSGSAALFEPGMHSPEFVRLLRCGCPPSLCLTRGIVLTETDRMADNTGMEHTQVVA